MKWEGCGAKLLNGERRPHAIEPWTEYPGQSPTVETARQPLGGHPILFGCGIYQMIHREVRAGALESQVDVATSMSREDGGNEESVRMRSTRQREASAEDKKQESARSSAERNHRPPAYTGKDACTHKGLDTSIAMFRMELRREHKGESYSPSTWDRKAREDRNTNMSRGMARQNRNSSRALWAVKCCSLLLNSLRLESLSSKIDEI